MVKICCLGWGSLIWNPRGLPVCGGWSTDGPALPLEFARVSTDGRVTLVICSVPHRVPALWARLEVRDLDSAKRVLANREEMEESQIARSIGFCDLLSERAYGCYAGDIGSWAKTKELDSVVWTNLKCGFQDSRGVLPSAEQVLEHLRTLDDSGSAAAEEYIRKAPRQIDTPYRREMEREFGWSCLN